MNDKRKKKNKNILTDLKKANGTVFCSYMICCAIYSLIGFFIFNGEESQAAWEVVLYYALLFFPLLSTGIEYKESVSTVEFRYNLYIPALFFYGYMLMMDRDFMYFIFAACMIGTSIIYYDTWFSKCMGGILVLLHVAVGGYLSFRGAPAGGMRILQALSILILVFFINLGAEMMMSMQRANMKEMRDQKLRFDALVSVGAKKLFEYDLRKDELILTKTYENGIENTRKIENFSSTAKQYRYVLYSDWPLFDEFIQKCREGEENIRIQLRLRNKNADYLWYQLSAKTLMDEEGNPGNVIGTIENIDEIKRYELRLQDENMRDPLSGLYKRAYANQLMAEFLDEQDGSEYAGILLIDIDNFSVLCEKMGNTFGDEVIRSIATDLDEIFYTSDILGRVSGDIFVVLMKYIRDPEHIDKKIHKLQEVVRKTYTEQEMNFTSTVTIGAAVYPTDGEDFAELYNKAEKALVYAKESGKDRHYFYDREKENEYAQCPIEDKHNRMKQRNELEKLYEKNDSDSLTELAFKLIEESKDTDSAINLLLRQVARQMELDGICIRRRVGTEYKMIYPYRCIISDLLPDFSDASEMTIEQWNREMEALEANNGMLFCGNTAGVYNERYREKCRQFGVLAFARSAFYERGECIGSIDFLDCQKTREWTKEERVTIQTLTNVISSYLLKMKAFEDASDTVEKLTGYDMITDFYKYEKFLGWADEYLKTAKKGKYAVVYVDFSNFKFINELYGYEVGDKILRDYADAARSEKDIFIAGSRVFSDNMVSLVKMVWEDIDRMKNHLLESGRQFAQKVQKEYLDSNLSLVIGVCPFTVDGSEIPFKNIVSNANLARKEAKKPENPNCVVYSEQMGEKMIREVSYVNDMENALRDREFVVYLQPKIDLKNHIITGAEALIRWIKPDGSMIFPNDFIPVFEKNKTITLLDYFVYEEVCKYLAERIAKKERLVCVSMNVSRIHLNSIDKLVSYIGGLLDKYKIPPYLLEFELTETVFTDTIDDTVELMRRLREMGVKVSMDDFGSGYSSLNVLTKLPLDVLKLDKEFLKDFETDPEGKIIIPSIIDMAKKLKLCVVCEGVETKQQVEFLRQVDCDLVQGYYYSRPVPKNVFSQMLADDDFVINHDAGKE